jgi:hypothetical protein
MCFMQYFGSRKAKRSAFHDSYYIMKDA